MVLRKHLGRGARGSAAQLLAWRRPLGRRRGGGGESPELGPWGLSLVLTPVLTSSAHPERETEQEADL